MDRGILGDGGRPDVLSADPDPVGTPEVQEFAATLERVCVETVESGKMTKDLALLIGSGQEWQTTEEFLASIDDNLRRAMG